VRLLLKRGDRKALTGRRLSFRQIFSQTFSCAPLMKRQQSLGSLSSQRLAYTRRNTEARRTRKAKTNDEEEEEVEVEVKLKAMMRTMIKVQMLHFDQKVLIQTMMDPMLPLDSSGTGFQTRPAVERVMNPTYYFSKPAESDTVNIKMDRIVLNTQTNRKMGSNNHKIGRSIFLFEIHRLDLFETYRYDIKSARPIIDF
jgi:hypothetical protein